MTRARRLHRIGVLCAAAAALGPLGGCASTHLEKQLQVATETGRLVPLDSVTVAYTVGGVQVIQRPNYANDVVAVHLYLLGGRRQLTEATQGIEALLLRTSKYGTAKYPGDATRKAWARTGSTLDLDPSDDWTEVGFLGVTSEFDSTWSVFAERVMHPTLAAASVALVREQMRSRVHQRLISPDGYLFQLSDSVSFHGRAYGLAPGGTEASLGALDSAALATYERTQMVTSRMLLVVVGNVSREAVEHAVGTTLATLPKGDYVWSLPQATPPSLVPVVMRARPVSTNYVFGLFEGPPASAKDYPAFRVATALLSTRVNDMVRDQHRLSYAVNAPFIDRGLSAGGVYFSTSAPSAVLPLVKDQIRWVEHLSTALFNMPYFTEGFVFDYLASNSTDDEQADFLARAQLYQGDYRKASDEMEELRHVTTSDVRSAAQHYFSHIQFVYVGDTTRVKRTDFASF
jgi:zinc protease